MSRPETPVRVPKAAGSYSPSIVDPGLRSEINTLLLQGGHIVKIQETLVHALQISPTNWSSLVATHALDLLRTGECTTFPDLMARVMADIKADTEAQQVLLQSQAQQSQSSTTTQEGAGGVLGGAIGAGGKSRAALPSGKVNGNGNGSGGKVGGKVETVKGSGEDGQSLALPAAVVEEGLRVTRECLEVVCEFQP